MKNTLYYSNRKRFLVQIEYIRINFTSTSESILRIRRNFISETDLKKEHAKIDRWCDHPEDSGVIHCCRIGANRSLQIQ